MAVRSGKDVFIVDICNKQQIIHFPSCGDGILKVIIRNDKYYRVQYDAITIRRRVYIRDERRSDVKRFVLHF